MPGRKREMTADLARAAARFQRWRRRRSRGARIPAALWDLALRLAAQHGVSRTAGALKLGCDALKKRLAQQPLAAGVDTPNRQPAFLELAPAAWPSHGPCLIEFSDGAGSTLRVHLAAGQVPDLAALARSFWDAR
jgi:hypothetical protein